MTKFTHLHLHTEYSLLDGATRIDKLIDRVKELGMDSVAITDHGVMYGIVNFYKTCMKKGIKPILGCEVYVSKGKYTEKIPSKDKAHFHLVLLAENDVGYSNLMKIVSEGFVNGFYYKPRVDISVLKKHNEGIIVLSSCLAGEVQQELLRNNYEKAKEIALMYNDIFGQENFYLELQDHGIKEQKIVNQLLLKLSKETNIPLVATNDVHYIKKEDAKVHDVLLCIQTGRTVDEENRMKFPSSEFYLKSPEEMLEVFPYAKEALENTHKIAERCNVKLDFETIHLPQFDVPDGYTNIEYFRHLCNEGLKERYKNITQELTERLEYEMKVIEDMGFVDYFLITWDFIKYAKDNGIMVGPGRGSAAGSLVSYTLGIIDIDPIKYNLIFERFLNPERVTMPDIDIDFCYQRREEVIEYVIKKYGEDKVAQIATFGTMAARGAIRDVGRALNLSYGEVDFIAKQIPMELGMTISKALDVNKKLYELYEEDETVEELIDTAKAVEGLPRHTSTHAAGIVVSKLPITEYVPLSRNNDSITTQFTMTELEELGLLKMDFLGLRNLTVIRDALNLIKINHNKTIDFSNSDYDDENVYKMFSKGHTLGVFQFESSGMRVFLKELKPTRFEDIVAANAMYRPGPMKFIPVYISGKENPDSVKYDHPILKPILSPTYGVIIYQEQVMQIVQTLGGFTLGRADLLRRAMGKKKMAVMQAEREVFLYGSEKDNIEGCVKKGISEAIGNKVYDQMIDFAKYAFNKSHSAAYAVIAYETAWLKYYYPVEFMAALLTSIMGNTNQVSLYNRECKRLGIEVLPPDINESYDIFTVTDKNKIRFGLSAVKNVGKSVIDAIVSARKNGKFTSITDFCQRIESGQLNKRALESLIKVGALDSLLGKRAQYLAVFERILENVNVDRKRNIKGQFSLFDNNSTIDVIKGDNLPDISEFQEKVLLGMEKEMIGVYVSGHPLSSYEEILTKISTLTTSEILDIKENTDNTNKIKDGSRVSLGGIIIEKRTLITKNNNMMAFVKIEDLYGTIDLIIFPKIFDRYNKFINEDSIISINGTLNISDEDEPKIIVDKILPLKKESDTKLYLRVQNYDKNNIRNIKDVLSQYPGDSPVYIYIEKMKKKIIAEREYWININDELIENLKNIVGKDNIKY